jgi:hypothetical protein
VPRRSFAGFENEPADQEIVALRDQLHLHLEPRIIPPGGSAFGSGGGFLPGPKRVLLSNFMRIGHSSATGLHESGKHPVRLTPRILGWAAGISEQSYYRWRKEYGSMGVAQAKQRKA